MSIALGDSANDLPMLAAADQSYLVQRPNGTWNPIELPNLINVPVPGPQGWIRAVNHLIDSMNLNSKIAY